MDKATLRVICELVVRCVVGVGAVGLFAVDRQCGENHRYSGRVALRDNVCQALLKRRGRGAAPPHVVDADEHDRDVWMVGGNRRCEGLLRDAAEAVGGAGVAIKDLQDAGAIISAVDAHDVFAAGRGAGINCTSNPGYIPVKPGDRVAEEVNFGSGFQGGSGAREMVRPGTL